LLNELRLERYIKKLCDLHDLPIQHVLTMVNHAAALNGSFEKRRMTISHHCFANESAGLKAIGG
jgi:hypothetical protein